MPDLSFANVQAKLPVGTIAEDAANNDVKISLKALMGEPAVALADQKVSEAISKLLDGCSKAQTTYNEAAATDLNSFPGATAGIPVTDADGNYFVTFTHTVTVSVPLDRDETSGVTL